MSTRADLREPTPRGSAEATFGEQTPLTRVLDATAAAQVEHAFGYTLIGELLQHLPRRYSHRGELTPLRDLPIGENVTIVARVLSVDERRMQRRRGSLLQVRVTDGHGHLMLTFFNQGWRKKMLRPGVQGQFAGKVTEYRGGLQLQHPDYQLFADDQVSQDTADMLDSAEVRAFSRRPIPVYPATGNMPSWRVEQLIETVLSRVPSLHDPAPEWLELLPLDQAYRLIHQPERDEDWQRARAALTHREALELQLALVDRRRRAHQETATPRPPGTILERFDRNLPSSLTGDQQRVGEEIARDLRQSHPMTRLLQGEVGSGKTLVALRAMLQVAESGGQSALLAPTEVLATQHYASLQSALGPELSEELRPTLLTGKLSTAARRSALLAIASGASRLVVGTHALISEATTFADLGLVVVDEQHRFGVDQREALRQKSGRAPHLLSMTATPIPRTIALTTFGELEVSTIRELPAGRHAIRTFVIHAIEDQDLEALAWARAAEEIAAGRGVYVVCPAITGEAHDGRNRDAAHATVEGVAAQLRQQPRFADARIAELTGATPSDEKDRVMDAFRSGEIDMLVATTVIEVGVDVPRATVMLVLEADRFGVSQLHQLRGRVGRGGLEGLCLLLTAVPKTSEAWGRLEAVAASRDGFALAEVDLQQRREGDVLGTQQSGGSSSLKLVSVIDDTELLEQARVEAEAALERGMDDALEAMLWRHRPRVDTLARS